MLATTLSAQNDAEMQRGRIENVTDYSQPTVSRHARIGSRSSAPLPCTGSPRIPVVLVQFNDLKFTSDVLINPSSTHSDKQVNALFTKFFNGNRDGTLYQDAHSMGSVHDYFSTVSDSIFMPEFTVIGPITLSSGFAYYGKDNGSTKDTNIRAFYNESCKLAIDNYDVDWAQFDNNGDGKVDLVFFIYAGEGQNALDVTEDAIWPKEGTSTLRVSAGSKEIVFGAYGCTNEIFNGKMDGIGTCVHEVSHGLGLCDLYDTKGKLFGMDYWDVMDSGNYCNQSYLPCGYSAYELDFMGWRALENLPLDRNITLTLSPISSGGIGYKLTDPNNSNKYYILENRQNKKYDSALGLVNSGSNLLGYSAAGKTHGLMVTYIQYNSSEWGNNSVNTDHEHLTIIPADGEKISAMGGYSKEYFESILGDLYPGIKNVTTFELLGQRFEVTENEDMTITLKVNDGTPMIDAITNASTSVAQPMQIYSVSGQPQQEMKKGINIIKYSDNSTKKVWVR